MINIQIPSYRTPQLSVLFSVDHLSIYHDIYLTFARVYSYIGDKIFHAILIAVVCSKFLGRGDISRLNIVRPNSIRVDALGGVLYT